MTRNAQLLRAVGDRIAAYPHLYDQSEWGRTNDCGTVGCVAGHAAELAGYRLDVDGLFGAAVRSDDVGRESTRDVARDALGLTDEEAARLFAGGWRPAGWDGHEDKVAGLVRDALYRLADGAAVADVSDDSDQL